MFSAIFIIERDFQMLPAHPSRLRQLVSSERHGKETAAVVGNKTSKLVFLEPSNNIIELQDAEQMFPTWHFPKHGVPEHLSFDCDPKLTTEYCHMLLESKWIN